MTVILTVWKHIIIRSLKVKRWYKTWKLLDIYEKIKNNSVVKACPKEKTSNEDDDNIDNIDVKLIYKRNEELQKNLEILKNENENLKINLDNCKNNIHQINRAYAIAARRGGSNISLKNKKINQKEELNKKKDYMNKHIKSKKESKTKCTTDVLKWLKWFKKIIKILLI